MDDEIVDRTTRIVRILTDACKKCSEDKSGYPIAVFIGNPGERGHVIPIPGHAAPEVIGSIIKEMMTDFMKFPGIEDSFTSDQISELNRLIGTVSEDIEISIFPTKN